MIKNECKAHPIQTLDLYCLMCNSLLCIYCDKYSHSSCTSANGEFVNYKQKLYYSSQLLQDFVHSSEERKTLINSLEEKHSYSRIRAERTLRLDGSFGMYHDSFSSMLLTRSQVDQLMSKKQHLPRTENIGDISILTPAALRVVQINEFSAFARNFIRELTEEVEKDVKFYNEYVDKMANIVGSESEFPELNERKENLETEVRRLIQKGKRISENNTLTEKETDIGVAESALSLEKASLQFFGLREPFSLDVRCIEIALDNMNNLKPNIRQRALCTM